MTSQVNHRAKLLCWIVVFLFFSLSEFLFSRYCTLLCCTSWKVQESDPNLDLQLLTNLQCWITSWIFTCALNQVGCLPCNLLERGENQLRGNLEEFSVRKKHKSKGRSGGEKSYKPKLYRILKNRFTLSLQLVVKINLCVSQSCIFLSLLKWIK